jgi:site-specific DNA recombinase
MRQDRTMPPFLAADVDPAKLDTVRVAVYARQSKARTDASEASPEAQLHACRSYVEARRGWAIVEGGEYADIGKSGWNPRVIRPRFEAMMAAADRGELDVIVFHELSRLTRQGALEAMRIDERLRANGVRLVSVEESFLDTSSAMGVAFFALIAALAKQDSDIKAVRLSNAKDEIRSVGGHTAGDAPYGMQSRRTEIGKLVVTTLEPDATYSPVVRRLVELAMAGHSYSAIATAMNSEGVPTPGLRPSRATEDRTATYANRSGPGRVETGVIWRAQTVRGILTHPAIGGFGVNREPRGEKGTLYNVIARDPAGQPLTPHTGIISGAEWLALQDKIATRKLRPATRPTKAVPRLLSGWRFARCGHCDNALGQSGKNYMCANPVGHGGLAVQQAVADDYVAYRVWSKISASDLSDPDDRAWLIAAATRFAFQRDLSGVEEERAETKAHLSHVTESIDRHRAERTARAWQGVSGSAAWNATMDKYLDWHDTCTARIAELDAQQDDSVRIPFEWFAPGDPLGEGRPWSRWDVFKRREFLGLFLEGVSFTAGFAVGADGKRHIVPIAARTQLHWRPVPDDVDAGALVVVGDSEAVPVGS